MGASCCNPNGTGVPAGTTTPNVVASHGSQSHSHDTLPHNGHTHNHQAPHGCVEAHHSTHDQHDHHCGEADDAASDSTCCGAEEHCDEKCIHAAAANECVKACNEDPDDDKHPHDHVTGGHKSDSACSRHLQDAFDRYSMYLDQVRCICRDALREGSFADKCCSKRPSHQEKQKHAHCDGQSCAETTVQTFSNFHTKRTGSTEDVDPEKATNVETMDFLVSGMDCTSCVDKLLTIFRSMPGVSSPHVNFVTGNGKVGVDKTVTSPEAVLRFASNASNFSLVRVVGGDFFLDILTTPVEAKRMVDNPPFGVTDAQILDKKTVRLPYDPAVIGARALLESVHDRCTGLAEPRGDPQLENSRRRLWDQLSKTLLAALFTIPVAVVAWGEGLVDKKTKGIISLILGTFVQLIAVPELYHPAFRALWYSRIVEMDMLVVMSITAAYGYSVIAFSFEMANSPLQEGEFFETSTMLITLILMGRLIAAFARVQAVAAVSLRSKMNSTAVLVTSGKDQTIDARLLQYGDSFKVLPHSRVPTDGVVSSGETEVDESMLTGESIPVHKNKGKTLIAGTINGDGTVVAQLTRLPGKNTVTDIAQLVEEAANSKPKLQDLADKVAGWFVPTMAVIAVVIFAVWLAVGLRVLDYSTGRSIGNAITYMVATLAVACPCALGLAVPMVLVVSGGIAARGGVIIKSAETTERARKITDVVFDKTGTITEDDLVVVEQVVLGDGGLALTAALVAGGKHPVSAAVENHLKALEITASPGIANVRVVPGAGIEATHNGVTLQAGNAKWTGTYQLPEVVRLHQAGLTTLIVRSGETPILVFGLRTRVRPEAISVIEELKSRNIACHLVSGDHILAAQAVATTVGIPLENVVGQSTPAEKRDYVAALMADDTKYVMFCGDGTNDAVAVAQANVGAQMGGGKTSSDVTQGASDVVLLKGLEGIPFLLNVSKASFHRMVFNFVWSAIYNVLAVTMASGAWVKFRIEPKYAGAGEMVSVVPVILAAVSLFLLNLR